MVRKHLAGKYVIQDEKQLIKVSDEARSEYSIHVYFLVALISPPPPPCYN